jgi:Signal peptidase (SPase) II
LSETVTAGRPWVSKAVLGLPGRLRLVLIVAISVLAVDHAAKLGAAWLEPSAYMHNSAPMVYDWALLVPTIALLIPSRVTAVLLGLFLGGGASNVADVYLWPGGVPDFIPVGDWVSNPADFAIFGGVAALMAWPVWKLFQIARRQYPERPGRAEEEGYDGRERFPTPTFRQDVSLMSSQEKAGHSQAGVQPSVPRQ